MDSIDFSHLKLREKVGAGSFGTVWEATYLGTPVAVKECVPSPDDTTAEFTSYFEREVELL
ncbi:Mitogen-activated protein kinase kinase kinase 7, partial [Massospora cicadina]